MAGTVARPQVPQRKTEEKGYRPQATFVRDGESLETNTKPMDYMVPDLKTVPQRRHAWGEFEVHPQTAKGGM
jgi:hypothetical protein